MTRIPLPYEHVLAHKHSRNLQAVVFQSTTQSTTCRKGRSARIW